MRYKTIIEKVHSSMMAEDSNIKFNRFTLKMDDSEITKDLEQHSLKKTHQYFWQIQIISCLVLLYNVTLHFFTPNSTWFLLI